MILIHYLQKGTALKEMCHSFVLMLFLKKTSRNVLDKNKYYVSISINNLKYVAIAVSFFTILSVPLNRDKTLIVYGSLRKALI